MLANRILSIAPNRTDAEREDYSLVVVKSMYPVVEIRVYDNAIIIVTESVNRNDGLIVKRYFRNEIIIEGVE